MDDSNYLKILAAIIYQLGGTFELKQESLDALGSEFTVNIPNEPLVLEFTHERFTLYPISVEVEES